MSGKPTPIEYDSKFDSTELPTVKLSYEDPDSEKERKKSCPQFDGTGGIEALLYVEERFTKTIKRLEVDSPVDYFELWEDVLTGTAEKKWTNLTSGLKKRDLTSDRFKETMGLFYKKYVPSDARDSLYKYLTSNNCRKPRKVAPLEHQDRMETLVRYASKLPGRSPTWTEEQIKDAIFESYPDAWKQAFLRSKITLDGQTLESIQEFMNNEKQFADKKDNDNKSKEESKKRKESKEGTNKNSKRENGRKKNRNNLQNPCRLHHTHEWSDCYDNPRGRNYRPDRKQGSKDGSTRSGGSQSREGRRAPQRQSNNQEYGGNGSNSTISTHRTSYYHGQEQPPQDPAPGAPIGDQHHYDDIGIGWNGGPYPGMTPPRGSQNQSYYSGRR